LELGRRRRRRGETELVHHPVGLGAPAGAAAVVDEGLLEPEALAAGAAVYGLVDAGGLPEAGAGDAVGPDAVPVLAATQAEEVAFFVSCALHHMPSFICILFIMPSIQLAVSSDRRSMLP